MKSAYEGNTNDVSSLEVEHKAEDQWQSLDLGLASPGFEIFVYAVFTCQHMYFRVNCAERGLVLNTADGSIVIGADQDWNIETLRVNFSGHLGSGKASPDDIDYIVSRMKQCPVSRNIRETPDVESTVILN
jgi:organic hydroperoxide reductase OsmC/OhrA